MNYSIQTDCDEDYPLNRTVFPVCIFLMRIEYTTSIILLQDSTRELKEHGGPWDCVTPLSSTLKGLSTPLFCFSEDLSQLNGVQKCFTNLEIISDAL